MAFKIINLVNVKLTPKYLFIELIEDKIDSQSKIFFYNLNGIVSFIKSDLIFGLLSRYI